MICGFPTPSGPCRRPKPVSARYCFLHAQATAEQKVESAKATAATLREGFARSSKTKRKVERVTPDAKQPLLTETQLAAIGTALLSNGVIFALIGGAALGLYEAPVEATRDVDVLVDRSPENLGRLAAALNQIDARIWISPNVKPIATRWTKELLVAHQRFINLVTNAGPLDINYSPDGLEAGFSLIADRIVTIRVRDLHIPVAPLDAILASKTAAGRPKDVQAVAKVRRWLATRKDSDPGSL
jgi:hypothetical protein